MKETIRIIGGQYRGKKLHFPNVDGLRPTPDRVRETLFNWLMHSIRNARCLDAFSGSGALGFEAFSRYADKVVLIEKDPTAYTNLKKTAESFNSPKLIVTKNDATSFIAQTKEQFDIVFLDPPFAHPQLLECIDTLATSNVLVVEGLLYIESPQAPALNPEHWEMLKSKQAGQVFYGLYRRIK